MKGGQFRKEMRNPLHTYQRKTNRAIYFYMKNYFSKEAGSKWSASISLK